jgi:polyphosphate kinase 2
MNTATTSKAKAAKTDAEASKGADKPAEKPAAKPAAKTSSKSAPKKTAKSGTKSAGKSTSKTATKASQATIERAPAVGMRVGQPVEPVEVKTKKIKNKLYLKELARLQIELVKLQEWIKHEGLKVVVIFEGRDAAGKGGVIKRITESLNPRICRVVALGTPTEREKTQWYFQRYIPHLPAAGEMVLFDRSWYNRAGVERVMGFCSNEEYYEFLRTCPEFERMLVRSGIILIKYWFSVSDEEQERRFQARIHDATKRWKLSPMDLESRRRWIEYSKAKDEMFAHTDIKQAPWFVVGADVKKRARLNCIRHLLSLIPYDDLTPEPIELPPRQEESGYVRPPFSDQTFVPEYYD